MECVSQKGLVVCSSHVLWGSPQITAPHQQLSTAALALWGSPFSCFPSFSAPQLQSAPLPCQIHQHGCAHFPTSYLTTKKLVEIFASFLGFKIVVPKFNYYFSLNSIFLKRGFPFYTVFVYKPVILCEKSNHLQ